MADSSSTWEWWCDNWRYSVENEEKLEAALRAQKELGRHDSVVLLTVERHNGNPKTLAVNVVTMEQKNLDTGYTRAVRRIVSCIKLYFREGCCCACEYEKNDPPFQSLPNLAPSCSNGSQQCSGRL